MSASRLHGMQAVAGARRHGNPRRTGGFTLVEVVVTLVIAAVLAAVAVPTIIPMWQQQRTAERQSNAELVYTTAQNSMAKLKAKGLLADGLEDAGTTEALRQNLPQYQTLGSELSQARAKAAQNGTTQLFVPATSATNVDSGLIMLSSDDDNAASMLALLVPGIEDQLSDVGFGGIGHAANPHYCIELNPTTGYVYGAFYSEDGPLYATGADPATSTYAEAAAQRNDDAALAAMHVAYYGGDTGASFEPTEKAQIASIGYFEFAPNQQNVTEVTSGYFFGMDDKGKVDANATSALLSGNAIKEGAVDSSDGAAYGVLVSKSRVDSGQFTAPTDVYPTPYSVRISPELAAKLSSGSGSGSEAGNGAGTGINVKDLDCYFYKLDSPDAAVSHAAKYSIHYDFHYMNQGQEVQNFQWTDDSHTGAIGSTVHVTNEVVDQMNNGQVWAEMRNNGYRIDLAKSTLSGKVAADGSLVLTVYLIQGKSSVTTTRLPDSAPDTPTALINGVGVWYPWATANDDTLAGLAFYVNQNFAASLNPGTSPTAGGSYQVRTDNQLQHIGSPYGSAQTTPDAQYLSATFRQTHDITVDGARDGASAVQWHPIGQAQANGLAGGQKPYFSGSYDGGNFTIHLVSGYMLADGWDNATQRTYQNEAYATSAAYHGFGLFGHVTGSISNIKVSVGSAGTPTALSLNLPTPHYGTLVADLAGRGRISNAHVSIASNSSLSVTNTVKWDTQSLVVGGLCGSVEGTARITDSSFVLEKAGGSSSAQSARFTLEVDSQWEAVDHTDVGGFVGRVDNAEDGLLRDCTLDLRDAASVEGKADGASTLGVGGFAGEVRGRAAVQNAKVLSDGGLSVAAGNAHQSHAGGLVGTVRGNASINQPLVHATGDLTVTVGDAQKETRAGGAIGSLEDSASFADDASLSGDIFSGTPTVTVDGNLTVTAKSNENTAYTGGVIGDAKRGTAISRPSLKVRSNATLSTNAQKMTSIGGAIGYFRSGKNLEAPAVRVDGRLTATSNSTSGDSTYVGGVIGYAYDSTETANASKVSRPTAVFGGNAAFEGTSSNDSAHVGGVVGRSAHVAIDEASAWAKGDFSATATSGNGQTFAGGLVGRLEMAELTGGSMQADGDLSSTAHSGGGGGPYAHSGGLIGAAEGSAGKTEAKNLSLVAGRDVNVKAESSNAYAGGLVGQAHEMQFHRVSLAESSKVTAQDGRAISVAARASNDSYCAGAFGYMDSVSVTDSYVASRNATLHLENSAGPGDGASASGGYTGGFAGYAAGRAVSGVPTIDSSYVAADISSSAQKLSGFVDATAKDASDHDRNPQITNDFALGSIAKDGGNGDGNAVYSFIRHVTKAENVRGNYAAVTDAQGATPYKFAGGFDLKETSRCFVYRADLEQLTDEKDRDGNDGAHPASYAYLTKKPGENAAIDVPWQEGAKTTSVLDFLGSVDSREKGIHFVAGSSAKGDDGAIYGRRSGTSNPFPTATVDGNGAHVNYGKWIEATR